MGMNFNIEVCHFADDGVWVATSEDIKGLTVEAGSLEAFIQALIDISTELLAHNHGLSGSQIAESTLHVRELRHFRTEEGGQVRQSGTETRRKSSPQLVLEDPVAWFDQAAVA